jgi:hypothetical protein
LIGGLPIYGTLVAAVSFDMGHQDRDMRTDDLRQHAAECLRQAEQAITMDEKAMFLDMAQSWLDLAQNAEAVTAAAASYVRDLLGDQRLQ